MNTLTLLAQATGDEPAGGAAAGEAIGATAAALVVDRADRPPDRRAPQRPDRPGSRARRASPSATPACRAGPRCRSTVLGVSLLTAVLGMYWDISLHIDNGRDAGPLANPAHYLILVGLYGMLLAGVLTMALAHDAAERHRRARGRRLVGAGRRAADRRLRRLRAHRLPARRPLAPPLRPGRDALGPDPPDADRRRLAGHARRRWRSPSEARGRARPRPRARGPPGRSASCAAALLVGGFLVALSTFQGEFDFGVPQFRMVLHPILIMLAAGIGLVDRAHLPRPRRRAAWPCWASW